MASRAPLKKRARRRTWQQAKPTSGQFISPDTATPAAKPRSGIRSVEVMRSSVALNHLKTLQVIDGSESWAIWTHGVCLVRRGAANIYESNGKSYALLNVDIDAPPSASNNDGLNRLDDQCGTVADLGLNDNVRAIRGRLIAEVPSGVEHTNVQISYNNTNIAQHFSYGRWAATWSGVDSIMFQNAAEDPTAELYLDDHVIDGQTYTHRLHGPHRVLWNQVYGGPFINTDIGTTVVAPDRDVAVFDVTIWYDNVTPPPFLYGINILRLS